MVWSSNALILSLNVGAFLVYLPHQIIITIYKVDNALHWDKFSNCINEEFQLFCLMFNLQSSLFKEHGPYIMTMLKYKNNGNSLVATIFH